MIGHESLYAVLQIDRTATLNEIKVAFKRQALRVHPDKGGSKEAFHLVYQALETLADPAARKKYDGTLTAPQPAERCKATKRSSHVPWRAHHAASGSTTEAWRANRKAAGETKEAMQTQLLMKVRDHLKRLPRAVRNDVIKNEFSQKQRLILEEWMVSLSAPAQLEAQHVSASPGTALVATEAEQPTAVNSGSTANKKRCRRRPQAKDRTRVSSCGSVYKVHGDENYYRASICFDALEIHTSGRCELQTALEYLVILTAVKQKMFDCPGAKHGSPFEERLREALISSAAEQGRNYADLGLRFAIFQPAGLLVAQRFSVRTPSVCSFSDLGKLRSGLRPFRKYVWNLGRSSIYRRYSPVQLEDVWQNFQKAIADAWEIGGKDSTGYIAKIRSRRMASADVRNRHLRQWESERMALHDKNRHRPKRLRFPSRFRSQTWERQRMNQEDRIIHQRTRPMNGTAEVSVLRKLLRKWKRMLNSEAQLVDKARRKRLQERKRQRNEQRQQEVLKRRQLRKQQQQERLRRDTLWKRMRSDQTMDNLAWI
eukprot:Skav205678  [mRNA]  locus=scaffold2818:64564:66418:+ [translate_table: standard]